MAATQNHRNGYARLLDAWSPPRGAGDPLGCVATSFTFSPVFFEEECLGRFLKLESDAREDGPLYLIEREEKLSQVVCAAAIVDQHHCRGTRSLRWDLLPARVPGALLHTKISLLAWARLTRIIIASANLTEDGYRRNQEVFGYLDYYEESQVPLHCLRETVAFLREIGAYCEAPVDEPSSARQRLHQFLERTVSGIESWGTEESRRATVKVGTVFSGPGRESCLDQCSTLWPGSSPPIEASVYSPFFDEGEIATHPATALWDHLRRRGKAAVHYCTPAEDLDDGVTLIRAPEILRRAQPHGRGHISTSFSRLQTEDGRPFHAKGLWFEDDRHTLYMIGSSNFTRRGLGLSKKSNLEANLAYQIDSHRSKKALQQLGKCWPDTERIDMKGDIRWALQDEDADDLTGIEESLPSAFSSATYRLDDESKGWVVLTISGSPPPGWLLQTDEDVKYFTARQWRNRNAPSQITIAWKNDRPPSGFWVSWKDSRGRAWWPVNVESAASLPPPQELKSLPLDILISILTSARPLHVTLGEYIRRKQKTDGASLATSAVTDPHKRVDTSGFLLQRTRRVSWALRALRERLQRPAVNEQCLEWRLRGPVGVQALADALIREADEKNKKGKEHEEGKAEKAFLLSELILELVRLQPRTAPGCLPVETVRFHIDRIVRELTEVVKSEESELPDDMKDYIDRILEGIS